MYNIIIRYPIIICIRYNKTVVKKLQVRGKRVYRLYRGSGRVRLWS